MAASQCRFCLADEKPYNLISPCICKGSLQYVHESCLQEWYKVEPERGLSCSVCKEPLARHFIHASEKSLRDPLLRFIVESNPILFILTCHTGYFLSLPFTMFFIENNLQLHYYMYQCAFHVIYIYFILRLIWQVKDKVTYSHHWFPSMYIAVPFINIYLFLTISTTYLVGGFGADLCIHILIKEHFRILGEMNRNKKFIFIDR